MLAIKRTPLRVRCSQQNSTNPVTVARKKFEKAREQTLKENFNRLVFIATNDVRQVTDFVKELDEIHKKAFDDFLAPAKPVPVEEENIFEIKK